MPIETRQCKSGFLACRVHYSIDPLMWSMQRIAAVRAALPGWKWRKEYEIDFAARGGRKVFDCFDPDVHVNGSYYDLAPFPKYRVIDHGRRNPTACLWWAEDKRNRSVIFYREYYRADATIAEHCAAIRSMESQGETRQTLIDPSTHRRLDNAVTTIADEYSRHGVHTTAADNNLAAGLEAVTASLLSTLARVSLDNGRLHPSFEDRLIGRERLYVLAEERALVFHPSMTQTIRQMEQLSWDDDADADDGRPLCERIREHDDHCTDCVRYAMLRPRLPRPQIGGAMLKRV